MPIASISIFRHATTPSSFLLLRRISTSIYAGARNPNNVSRKFQPNLPNKNLLKARDGVKHLSSLSPALSLEDMPQLSPNQAIGMVASAQANFMRVIVQNSERERIGLELLCVVRNLLKKIKRRVSVGDKVLVSSIDWVDGRGMIENVFERKSEILDPPVANVDQLLVFFSLEQPKLEPFSLTRFLVEAESTEIPLTLVLNKMELVDEKTLVTWQSRLHDWRYKLCSPVGSFVRPCSYLSPMLLPKISATSLNRRFSRFFTTLQYTNRLYLNRNRYICSEGNVPILSSTNKATFLVFTGFRFGSQRSYVPCPVEPCKTSSFGLLSRQTPSIAVPYDDIFRWLHVRHSSNSLIELNTDNNVVKFNVDNRHVNNKNEKKDKTLRKKKMSKKAKLNELRFYRLKAKKKMNSPNPEVRIRYKLDKAKRKEEWLIEKLRKFDVPKMPAETHDPEILTEEERFYLKRTGEKKKNYVPVGRRGVFGGVVLNMHLHWKNHETVKVVCKPCKPGQIRIYAEELARLSKGIVIDIKPNNTIIFYRGKNYVQPEIMSPPDTLSKAKALEKYKFEQSLEHTSEFIEKLENELEEYYKHLAQYRKVNEDAL